MNPAFFTDLKSREYVGKLIIEASINPAYSCLDLARKFSLDKKFFHLNNDNFEDKVDLAIEQLLDDGQNFLAREVAERFSNKDELFEKINDKAEDELVKSMYSGHFFSKLHEYPYNKSFFQSDKYKNNVYPAIKELEEKIDKLKKENIEKSGVVSHLEEEIHYMKDYLEI